MSNNDKDDTGGNYGQPCETKQHNNKTILGHTMTFHELDNWRQVCFQWCQRQQGGQTNNCSMYCFKYKDTSNNMKKEPLPTTDEISSPTATTTTTSTDVHTNIKRYITDTLKNYSFVVVKGTGSTTDDYIKAHQNDQLVGEPRIHEINVGRKAEIVMNNAELLVKKTHDFSKDLVHTLYSSNSTNSKWMNGFGYSDTFRTIKERAVKMMDVARGKYDDDADNSNKKLKKSPNQEDSDEPADTNLDQDSQDDHGNNSKNDS